MLRWDHVDEQTMSAFPKKYAGLLYFLQASDSYFELLFLVLNVFAGRISIFVKKTFWWEELLIS